jgi:transposase
MVGPADLQKRGLRWQLRSCTEAASEARSGSGDRIKTDRRDAVKLAQFLRSGDLTEVQIPDVETEAMRAMRDLEQARDDAERAARHQLIKFLLRHDRK